MSPTRRNLWSTVALLAVFVALVLAYPDLVRSVTERAPAHDPNLPPAFSGNRAAYGFALFSMFSGASIALRKLILIVAQLKEANWREEPDVGLYRLAIVAFLLCIILGTAPDVALLLFWGEVGSETLTVAMTVDRICDGLFLVPFLMGIAFVLRAEQLEHIPVAYIARALDEPPHKRALFLVLPSRDGLAAHVRIIASVLVIALGLALFK